MSEYLQGRFLLLALSGHYQAPSRCLLLGAKQTLGRFQVDVKALLFPWLNRISVSL